MDSHKSSRDCPIFHFHKYIYHPRLFLQKVKILRMHSAPLGSLQKFFFAEVNSFQQITVGFYVQNFEYCSCLLSSETTAKGTGLAETVV